MSEGVLVKDSDRLPWLEPYRAPREPKGRRFAGMAAIVGLALAGGSSVLVLRQEPAEVPPPAMPRANVEFSRPTVEPEVAVSTPVIESTSVVTAPVAAKARRKVARRATYRQAKRRVLKSPVERLAYRDVVLQQSVTAPMPAPVPYDPPLAPPVSSEPPAARPLLYQSSLFRPLRYDTPLVRPVVNPSARLVRGKSVQLGAYLTPRQAEIAWQRAIRDYTFLVTFPKDISLVQLGPRRLRFYRLQLGTPSRRHARQLCSNLKSTGRNCTVA
jgi:hypothetical protein